MPPYKNRDGEGKDRRTGRQESGTHNRDYTFKKLGYFRFTILQVLVSSHIAHVSTECKCNMCNFSFTESTCRYSHVICFPCAYILPLEQFLLPQFASDCLPPAWALHVHVQLHWARLAIMSPDTRLTVGLLGLSSLVTPATSMQTYGREWDIIGQIMETLRLKSIYT